MPKIRGSGGHFCTLGFEIMYIGYLHLRFMYMVMYIGFQPQHIFNESCSYPTVYFQLRTYTPLSLSFFLFDPFSLRKMCFQKSTLVYGFTGWITNGLTILLLFENSPLYKRIFLLNLVMYKLTTNIFALTLCNNIYKSYIDIGSGHKPSTSVNFCNLKPI